MKDKITIFRPTGEQEERKVICHFKSMDDTKPNIKGIPILVVDKNENNNGNAVLEFFYQKDGMYQAINDEASWAEVKSVVIDIIKNNANVVGEE